MQAIRVEQFGDPGVLQLKEVATPAVGPGEVLIRVQAAGVNPVEAYIRSGNYGQVPSLPYTPGTDAAGMVTETGDGVSRHAVGDRVYTSQTKSGAYAEFALCDESKVYPLPENVSFAQGAALGVPYATAWCALMLRAGAKKGETVLVHGATGAVGLASVQIALAHGLTVIATGGSAEGRQLLHDQGVRYIFDHHAPDAREEILAVNCGRGPDIILEMLANQNLANDLKMIARKGRIVVVGNRGEIAINPRDAMSRDASIIGMSLMNASAEEIAEIHQHVSDGLRNQTLKPVIKEELPLSEAAKAHHNVLNSNGHGKIVLIPNK